MIENVSISTFHSIQNSVENMREKSLKSKKILYILPISDLYIKILCIFIADKFFLYEIVLFIYFKVRNHQTTFRTSKGLHELHFPRWEAPIFLLVMLKSTLTSMHLWPCLAKKTHHEMSIL